MQGYEESDRSKKENVMSSTLRQRTGGIGNPALPLRLDGIDLEELRNNCTRAPYQMTGAKGAGYRAFAAWIESDLREPGAVARWGNLSPAQQEKWERTAQRNRKASRRDQP
jgi:hypothetical protein